MSKFRALEKAWQDFNSNNGYANWGSFETYLRDALGGEEALPDDEEEDQNAANPVKPTAIPLGDPSLKIPIGDPDVAVGGGGVEGGQNAPEQPVKNPFIIEKPASGGGGILDTGFDIGIPGFLTIGDIMALSGLADMSDSGGFGGSGSIFGGGSGGGSISGSSGNPIQPSGSSPGVSLGPESGSTPLTIGGPLGVIGGSASSAPSGPTGQTPPMPESVSSIEPEGISNAEPPEDTSSPITIPPIIPIPETGDTNPPVTIPVVPPPTGSSGPSGNEGNSHGPPVTIPPVIPPDNGGSGPNENSNPIVTIPPVFGRTGNEGNSHGPPITIPPVIIPPSTTPPVVTPPVVNNPSPTMPDTTIASPLDRNYYREGNQSTQDLQALLNGMMGLYSSASGGYGQTDFQNFQNILNQYAGANNSLTGLANDQTSASNTALRTSNIGDVNSLANQALAIQQRTNPNLYSSLDAQQQAAQQFLNGSLQQYQDANFLSPQERNNAVQQARESWSARGLVNSPGAVGDEILNTDAALRARQQQAFQNLGTSLQSYGQNTALQGANRFDPFATILGSQYGQQTQNAGTNNSLYGQNTAFSSGANLNQYVGNQYNPFSNYGADVYGSNFNSATARNIASANNAAAIQGANSQANSSLVNGFLNFAGNYLSRNPSSTPVGVCWVARECLGTDNGDWILFRFWLTERAPKWFYRLYAKHGERFASWVSDKPILKSLIAKWMKSKVKSLPIERDFST